MTLIDDLLNRVQPSGDDRGDDYYECRHCGRTLSHEDETCTACGSEDVATFFL